MTRFLWTFAVALAWHGVALGASQGEVEIVHDPIECWPVDQFLMLRSSFVPPEDIQTAKFYFRSTEHPDYYYVEMTLGADGGVAIGPKAEPTTEGVSYYIELVTRSYSSYRTDERIVPVASGDECRRRDPETAFYNGQNPDIAVGATRGGATPLPPGFQSDGITRFLNATGIVGDSGGGVSGKTIGIIGGLGGAGAAALALSGGSKSNSTTTSPFGGSTSSAPLTSTSTAIGGGSSSTTTTTGGGGSSSTTTSIGSTTTVGGGSTTTVIGSSTTTIVGSSTTTIVPSSTTTTIGTSTTTSIGTSTTTSVITSSVPSSTTTTRASTTTTSVIGSTSSTSSVSSSSVSTSVPSSTTTSNPPTTTSSRAATADLQVSKSGTPGTVALNERITYTIRVTNNGPDRATAVVASDTLPNGVRMLSTSPSCAGSTLLNCSLGTINVGGTGTLTIVVIYDVRQSGSLVNRVNAFGRELDNVPGNNSASTSTGVRLRTSEPDAERPILSYQSELTLDGPRRNAKGFVVLNNGEIQQVGAGAPTVFNASARAGTNQFEAYLEPGGRATGLWRFDFRGSDRMVPGSLRVESGRPVSLEDRSVVFALDSDVRIRFTVELQ